MMQLLFRFLAFASLMALTSCISDDFSYSMAQSSCVGLDTTGEDGYIYAVKRTPGDPLGCNQICADGSLWEQDPVLVIGHYHLGKCINGIQVTAISSQFPSDVMKLGPRIFLYNN